MCGIPQVGAPERLGAMHENLVHLYDDGKFWGTIRDAHELQYLGIIAQCRAPVHPQGVVETGHDEQQSDNRIGDDIAEGIEAIIARPVRYRQGAGIENLYKARRIAAGADIGLSFEILGADAEKRRPPYEFLRMFAEPVLTLLYRQGMCRLEQPAKRLLIRDRKVWIEFQGHHDLPL
ncbi:hypothetical protein D3C86_1276470 [compost metagenome]